MKSRLFKLSLSFLFLITFTACQGESIPENDQSGEEFGAILPTREQIAAFPKALPPEAVKETAPAPIGPPSAVLLSNTPPVGQQGPCSLCSSQGSPGSCISWSGAYGLGTYTVNQSQNWGVDDPAHQVSAAFMYAWVLNKEGKTCPSGSSEAGYLNFLVQNGSVSGQSIPYEANCNYLGGIDLSTPNDPAFKIGSWQFVSPQDRDLIKSHLANGQAVAFAGHLYQGFGELQGPDVFYGSGPFMENPKTKQLVGHGMFLIGYNDNLGDPAQGLGAYRIQNSFGTTWGDNGYLWMSYATFENSILSAFVAEPVTTPVSGAAELTPDSPNAPLGRITLARQWLKMEEGKSRVHLVFRSQFDDAVEIKEIAVTDPSGKTATHSYEVWHRSGYTHLSRLDGHSFLPGNYSIRFNTVLPSGEAAIYSGQALVGNLNPPAGLTPKEFSGTIFGAHGQVGRLFP
ncbi:MAG: C1 family peptidase [bacterium]